MSYLPQLAVVLIVLLIGGSARLMWLRKAGFDPIGKLFAMAAVGAMFVAFTIGMLHDQVAANQRDADSQVVLDAFVQQSTAAHKLVESLPLAEQANALRMSHIIAPPQLKRLPPIIPTWLYVCLGVLAVAEWFLAEFRAFLIGEPSDPAAGTSRKESGRDE